MSADHFEAKTLGESKAVLHKNRSLTGTKSKCILAWQTLSFNSSKQIKIGDI
jgi:hypothetical protein